MAWNLEEKNKGREKNLVVIVWEDGHTVNYLFKKLKSTKFRLFFPQQICFPGITKTFPISEWKCIKITFFIVFFPKKLKFLFKSSSYVPQSKVEDAELWKFHDFLQSGSGDFRTPVEIWNSKKYPNNLKYFSKDILKRKQFKINTYATQFA